jgi:hypothetical protein
MAFPRSIVAFHQRTSRRCLVFHCKHRPRTGQVKADKVMPSLNPRAAAQRIASPIENTAVSKSFSPPANAPLGGKPPAPGSS